MSNVQELQSLLSGASVYTGVISVNTTGTLLAATPRGIVKLTNPNSYSLSVGSRVQIQSGVITKVISTDEALPEYSV